MKGLAEICDDFQTGLEALEPADADMAVRLKGLITRLMRDAIEHVADHSMGEIPAITQRCGEALAAIAAEAQSPEDRRCRYRRRAALVNLAILVDATQSHHAGSRAQQRKSVEELRDQVAASLQGLVEAGE